MRRVNESVRAVVAEGLGDLKDPRIGMVTVTGVVVTPDLGEARIFVSVFGNEKKRRSPGSILRAVSCRRGSTASSACDGRRH